MKNLLSVILSILFVVSFSSVSRSQNKPVQLSLVNPIQIVPESQSINGFRFNLIYGKNVNVTGFDLGFANHTTGKEVGVQWGIVNLADGGVTGWQDGFVNITKGMSVGLQSGTVNYNNGHFKGLQIAIVNYAATLKGLQIGLINIIGKGGFLPVFPFFNFDFN